MQHGKAAEICSRDMLHGHAYTLFKTLAFPPSEWICALEPGFWCSAAKNSHFFSLSALSLFRALFIRAPAFFFAFRSRAQNGGKARPPSSVNEE
jgi:hypothetical protein